MSDWVQPFADAGWSFDERSHTVRSTGAGEWFIVLRILVEVGGRYIVILRTCDAAGGHERLYGFRKFHNISAHPSEYHAFLQTLIEWGEKLTKQNRGEFAKELASQVRAAGARMVWVKKTKKVEL